MARNPLSDPDGYVGDVPSGRPSYAPDEDPDTRPADLMVEKAELDAASADGDSDGVPDAEDVDSYATGGGWYEIDGEKYHGKDAAQEALDAKRADG